MENFHNKVAVITGAASGIGKSIAERCAKEGMRIVLADIEEETLYRTERDLKAIGAETLAVVTDVGKEKDVNLLAEKTLQAFGEVHLLFNNAGVGGGTMLWESTLADWQWVMNVNLWGVIYATRSFVPIMLKQNNECHIVNTASRAGLETGPFNGIYRVTKHAVVSFSETLYHELKTVNTKIGVSVLCPGFVNTQICDAHRNRPENLANPLETQKATPEGKMVDLMIREAVADGISPEEVAEITFRAIEKNQFYILTDTEAKGGVKHRMAAIINGENPAAIIPEALKVKMTVQ
ncbi:NADP-dependent 3-hydroxy acid dehydrogenase YdfG [Natronincola peptidivorans]|uniref:NADP-dependent 3-hydroxy acid dehydrogenase YdfG n=1 Tax=Natronincola peptidivorans TaxID=426128 RepID=A0A1I0AXC8_9FIRM|nr:SDR family NAD(P)-dependent oxidoreductase [Natronincola peptidivorans]SES99140.1 NADP-dependent 3-hydroxy acid dehydrogenase YdfG [Natronincola peptidivorans]